jgi:hypothetical protein
MRTRRGSSTAISNRPTIPQHDAPFQNPLPADPDGITVTDPAHPLYGRCFPVLSISHPPDHPGHVVVAYRTFMRLRIPVQATNLAADNGRLLRTTFTRSSLLELFALLKECEDPCTGHPGVSGNGSPTA